MITPSVVFGLPEKTWGNPSGWNFDAGVQEFLAGIANDFPSEVRNRLVWIVHPTLMDFETKERFVSGCVRVGPRIP